MHKKLLPWQILTLLALVAPALYMASVWAALPAQVPTHFNLQGQANGYTPRGQMWLLVLGLPLGAALLLTLLPRLDPKGRLDADSVNFQKLRLVLVALLASLGAYMLYVPLHPGANASRGVLLLLGLFFAFFGNYLTTVRPNYFIGIRTPWTLESPTVWARTHRVGGILFCVAGLLIAGLALVLPMALMQYALLALLLGTTGFSYAYSYFIFRQEVQQRKAA